MGSDGQLYIGTSGYQYPHWSGAFYPTELPKAQWLDYYTRCFNALEINATFYSLPRIETVARWRESAPAGFRFVVKFSRYGSHIKRLKDPEQSLPHFFERMEPLKPVCGGVLLQLPPNWRPNPQRLDAFLGQAPAGWRWAVEVRDPRWLCEPVYQVLRRHDAALCWHDLLPDHPQVETAGWRYWRFHGGEQHDGGYAPETLDAAADDLNGCRRAGQDCFVFFDNDVGAHAPVDAQSLQRRLAS